MAYAVPTLGGIGAALARSVAAKSFKKSPRSSVPRGVQMSKCALKYALAVSEPLSPQARGACVPYGANESQKVHAMIRLDVKVGTAGYGAVLLAPCAANNLPSIYYTTSLYSGDETTPLDPWNTASSYGSQALPCALTTGWAVAAHNGPYNAQSLQNLGQSTSVNPQIQSRFVAAGARIQYTGTTLNESGMYTCYHDASHNSVAGKTLAQLQGNSNTQVEGTTRQPCTLRVFGVNETEMSFNDTAAISVTTGAVGPSDIQNIYPFSPTNVWSDSMSSAASGVGAPFIPITNGSTVGGTVAGVPVGAIVFSGVAGQTYHLECVFHMEFIGASPSAFYTPVAADPTATQMVRTAAAQLPARMIAKPRTDAWSIMYSALSEAYTIAKPVLVPAAQAALAALVL